MAVGDTTVNLNNPLAKKGAVFDGVDDRIDIPHNANQLLTTGFTLSAWINPVSLGENNRGMLFSKEISLTVPNGYLFRVALDNRLVGLIAAGGDVISDVNAITLNKWQHVIMTVNSDSLISFYINNILVGTPNTSGLISNITSTNKLSIGNRSERIDRTFDGLISEIKIWNKVLSSAETAKVYGGNPVTDGLILDVPLKDDYNDKSDTGLTGTNSGTYFSSADDQVASDVSDARVTANDIIKVFPLNNKIMNVNIEEA